MVIANYKVTVISSCKLQVASFCSGVSARMTPGGTAALLYSCTDVQLCLWGSLLYRQ